MGLSLLLSPKKNSDASISVDLTFRTEEPNIIGNIDSSQFMAILGGRAHIT